jgi:hypothetical protein
LEHSPQERRSLAVIGTFTTGEKKSCSDWGIHHRREEVEVLRAAFAAGPSGGRPCIVTERISE